MDGSAPSGSEEGEKATGSWWGGGKRKKEAKENSKENENENEAEAKVVEVEDTAAIGEPVVVFFLLDCIFPALIIFSASFILGGCSTHCRPK